MLETDGRDKSVGGEGGADGEGGLGAENQMAMKDWKRGFQADGKANAEAQRWKSV